MFRKIYLNCRSSEHCKKSFLKICTFLQLCICLLETELNFDPDPNLESDLGIIPDPDPNLQIISDLAGSRCTTLHYLKKFSTPINVAQTDSLRNCQ